MVYNGTEVMAEMVLENIFLVEIRLGRTKWRIKETTAEIGRIFQIAEFCEKHPHITLFGPFSLKKDASVAQLRKVIGDVAQSFGAIPFLVHGYDMNQGLNGAVIAYRVITTDPLVELTEAIMAGVGGLSETSNIWDRNASLKWFHVTIANNLDRGRAIHVFNHLSEQAPSSLYDREKQGGIITRIRSSLGMDQVPEHNPPPSPPLIDEDGLRITIVNGDHILAEYDLMQHRWIPQHDPGAVSEWQRTMKLFRRSSGFELPRPLYTHKDDIFVISDLHLGHANIIKYCSRPFPHDAVDEMDQVLIRNWNYTVKPGDRIYHIGDLCYGPHAKNPSEYLQRLNGRCTLIQGNHEGGQTERVYKETIIHNNIPFLLIHDPGNAPRSYDGWVIHGHHHNNDLKNYPFINFENRRINASAEMVKYQPVNLSDLCTIIKSHQSNPKVKSILLREK